MADSNPAALHAIHALSSLSVEHRRVVVRAYYLGQTVTDIAAHEQIGECAVMSRLHYALQGLVRAMEGESTLRGRGMAGAV